MHFTAIFLAFTSSALATTFVGYHDASCQRPDGSYGLATAAQLEDLTLQEYPTASLIGQSEYAFDHDYEHCPVNTDHTYAWLDVPQWQQGKSLGGGKIAVIYMKETDTYYLCRTLAEVVGTYAGLCK